MFLEERSKEKEMSKKLIVTLIMVSAVLSLTAASVLPSGAQEEPLPIAVTAHPAQYVHR